MTFRLMCSRCRATIRAACLRHCRDDAVSETASAPARRQGSYNSNQRMRFKLTIEYAGTRYSGWQIQQNARTIQGEIDRAVREVTGAEDFELYGSGRTDAGVHALAQVAHLDVHTLLSPELLRRRFNEALPSDITILRVEPVRHRFHARHDAIGAQLPLSDFATEDGVRQAVRLVGEGAARDRADATASPRPSWASTTSSRSRTTTLRRNRPRWRSTTFDIHEDDDLLVVHIEGSHFIWKMVRRLVGVLVAVGRGDLTVDEVAGMLVTRSEMPARLTAPASGLFLERVYYVGDRRDAPVRAAATVLRV